MRAALPVLALVAACTSRYRVVVHAPEDGGWVYEEYVAQTRHPFVEVRLEAEPRARGGGVHLVVRDRALAGCAGCYRLERVSDRVIEVQAGDPLGAQYGLTAALESMDFRFVHPHATYAPVALSLPEKDDHFGVLHEPQIARRGLHLHTLHPTDGMMDFWEPDPDGLERAKRVVDWTVRNRGNHLQWVALDDIQEGDAEAWRDHTREIVDYAHRRGLTTGLGIQLFGSSNLQQAWDLVDDPGDPVREREQMDERLAVVGDLGFDVLNLSFGEFFAEEPEVFVDAAERAYDAIQAHAGPVEVPAVVHVGNYDDLRVQWQGEELLYYFLAAETGRDIVPWIHSVMYYNLFEDAGGAYLHESFDEHRAFLLEALSAGEPVGYFPETAYWVAFDINVPTWLPVYVRSRWTDLDRIRDAGPQVQDHVIFSSGWEWGYWQNDYATLRASYELPDRYEALYDDLFEPYGAEGVALARAATTLADRQHDALIDQRLAAYLAGREAVIDLGDNLGIISQPDRPSFDEVAAFTPDEAAAFDQVLAGLASLSVDTREILVDLEAAAIETRFAAEMVDGAEVDALRTEFAHAVFSAALAHGSGADAQPHLLAARAARDAAVDVVARRHAALWDPDPGRLVAADRPNATVYAFGYLARADELCFWERELVQVENLVNGATAPVPPCTG